MTTGKFQFVVDQGISDSITVSYGEFVGAAIIRQGDNKIVIRKDNIKQFEEAITSLRRWSSSK